MNEPPVRDGFNQASHDHGRCVADALLDAEKRCRENGLRLTRIRRKVLETVWRGHEPVKAYDILNELNKSGEKTAPPTVYRALDFLLQAGFVHRVDTLNAFVGCPHRSGDHSAQLLICSDCGQVAEIDDSSIRAVIARGSARHGFKVAQQTVEIHGLCPQCRED